MAAAKLDTNEAQVSNKLPLRTACAAIVKLATTSSPNLTGILAISVSAVYETSLILMNLLF